MKLKSTIPFLCICMAIAACNNGNPKDPADKVVVVDSVKVVDTVKSHPQTSAAPKDKAPAKTEPQPQATQPVTPPVKPVTDWHAMMREYHDLLCKEHTGNASTDNKIREVELGKELKDEPKTYSADDKYYFSTEMARTLNMESCK
jgi:hypothetical protein